MRFNQCVAVFFLIIIPLGMMLSCQDTGTRPDEVQFVLPDSNVHFIEDIQPMFEAKCSFESGCHSPEDTGNPPLYVEIINRNGIINYRLTSTGEQLINLAIHKDNPQLAPLYLILKEGYPDPVEDQMPPLLLGREPLNENQLNGILQWIREGAPE